MSLLTHLLPHFSRFISATHVQKRLYDLSTAVVFLSIIGLMMINTAQRGTIHMSQEFERIIRSPFSISAHFTAAQLFKDNNLETQKSQELRLLHDLMAKHTKTNVLGDSIDILSIVENWDTEPKQLEEKLIYWKTIIAKHPDYRDAYLQASYIAALLQKNDSAISLFNQAKLIDPTVDKVNHVK